jgi:hypothetical protein
LNSACGFKFEIAISRNSALMAQRFAGLADIAAMQNEPVVRIDQILFWNSL